MQNYKAGAAPPLKWNIIKDIHVIPEERGVGMPKRISDKILASNISEVNYDFFYLHIDISDVSLFMRSVYLSSLLISNIQECHLYCASAFDHYGTSQTRGTV
jgi:hypothetical protein